MTREEMRRVVAEKMRERCIAAWRRKTLMVGFTPECPSVEEYYDDAEAAIGAIEASGAKIVFRRPTAEMIDEASGAVGIVNIFCDMFDAAPLFSAPPTDGEGA